MKRIDSPPNPYVSTYPEWLEPPPPVRVEVFVDGSRSILSENDSPDVGFRWSVNPYRGCQHACAYCYARPTHEYLGFGAGSDFESKLIVKPDAPKLLAQAFRSSKWCGELVAMVRSRRLGGIIGRILCRNLDGQPAHHEARKDRAGPDRRGEV